MKKMYLKIKDQHIDINDDLCENIRQIVYEQEIPIDEIYLIIDKHSIEFQQGICNVEHFLEYFEYTDILKQIDLSEFDDDDLITLIAEYNKSKPLNIHYSSEEGTFTINNIKELPILDFNADIYTIIK